MVANLNHYRSNASPSGNKDDLYGEKHQLTEPVRMKLPKSLQEHHVDYLAVAVADEGSELRKAGITASIIIMDPELTAFKNHV